MKQLRPQLLSDIGISQPIVPGGSLVDDPWIADFHSNLPPAPDQPDHWISDVRSKLPTNEPIQLFDNQSVLIQKEPEEKLGDETEINGI